MSNIDVSARTVLNWVQTFGPQLAATLRKEFAKLLGAQALYRCFVTLPVTNSVKFLEKCTVTHGEGFPSRTFLTKHQTISQTRKSEEKK